MLHSNVTFQPSSRQKAELSQHAQKRCQQRGFDHDVVPVVTAFGDRSYDGRGGIRYLMSGNAMSTLVRTLGRNQRIDALTGVYVVVSADDGSVITIGHRYN